MAPTVILIRHAQALHNASYFGGNYDLHDPSLTELGFGLQCQELAKYLENELPLAQKIELIVISPMRRTLQTAEQSLGWLMKRGVPVVLRPEWQENSAKPCDTGTPIPTMEKEWPQFNWSTVDPVYPAKTGLYEYSKQGITERGIAARNWLRNRPEKVIAVVSHSGFMRVGVSYKKYNNADFRIFDFADGHEEVGGKLVEWELTEAKGGGLGISEKGTVVPGPSDFPRETETEKKIEKGAQKGIGEVANEEPK